MLVRAFRGADAGLNDVLEQVLGGFSMRSVIGDEIPAEASLVHVPLPPPL